MIAIFNLLKHDDNHNRPLVDSDNEVLGLTYFNLLELDEGQCVSTRLERFESVYVVLSGRCDITVDGECFSGVGQRQDIWSGRADSVYAPVGSSVQVRAHQKSEIAVAGGACDTRFEPFRVFPDEVEMVDVGSVETGSRRRIFHILGQNAEGRAGNLLVSELYADPGCWSGYPPHKHDEERGDKESAHEELYHYRFRPESGFGAQFYYLEDGSSQVVKTGHGDTFIFDRGYHPTVTSPGHEEYIFTVLVGKQRRSLIQHFDPEHTHLMDVIPGIGAMRDKFK